MCIGGGGSAPAIPAPPPPPPPPPMLQNPETPTGGTGTDQQGIASAKKGKGALTIDLATGNSGVGLGIPT